MTLKGRLFTTLFALPFFAVGVWMLWSISHMFFDAWRASDWQPVQARLEAAGYETHRGDDSTTYRAFATYTYTHYGQAYRGDRVSLFSGGDNIGSYQQELGQRLRRAHERGEPITVWMNPDDPSESVVDRTIRWGMVGFRAIFLFVFGGIGLGLLIVTWRARKAKDESRPEFRQSPWLLNDKWQTASIRSNAKWTMWFGWGFAGLWSLISAPMPFVIYEEVTQKQNTIALVGLLFPIIGIALLVWAIRRTLEWRALGATPVVLDPFPGSIGGHVGGTIDLRMPYDSKHRFMLTLSNIHVYVSGSGDNRRSREDALWQEELVGHTESGPLGTRLSFRFDVPEGQVESDADQSGDSFHIWRLNVRAELPSVTLDRDFNIPVYATATGSQHLADRQVASARAERDAMHAEAIRKLVRVSNVGVGKMLSYPIGQNPWANLAGIVIGSTFAGAGGWMIVKEEMLPFGGIFALVGGLITLAALYMVFKSLDVTVEGNTIRSTRRILGIPVRRCELSRSSFRRFDLRESLKTQSGGKHVTYYKVVGIGRDEQTIVLGEGFRGQSQARAATAFLARELGLREIKDSEKPASFDAELVNDF